MQMLENKVFKMKDDHIPLTPSELAYETNLVGASFKPSDFPLRVSGKGFCECPQGGEFVLLPIDDKSVQEGGKRYMQCRKCECWSHL